MKMGFGIIWNKNLYETQFGKEKLSTLVTSVSFFQITITKLTYYELFKSTFKFHNFIIRQHSTFYPLFHNQTSMKRDALIALLISLGREQNNKNNNKNKKNNNNEGKVSERTTLPLVEINKSQPINRASLKRPSQRTFGNKCSENWSRWTFTHRRDWSYRISRWSSFFFEGLGIFN